MLYASKGKRGDSSCRVRIYVYLVLDQFAIETVNRGVVEITFMPFFDSSELYEIAIEMDKFFPDRDNFLS